MRPAITDTDFRQKSSGHAVWLYHRFCLSLRDVEDLLAQRGIIRSLGGGFALFIFIDTVPVQC